MHGDVAIISDATGSLGFELAHKLYVEGNATVVMGCNNMTLCNEQVQSILQFKVDLYTVKLEKESVESEDNEKECSAEASNMNQPHCIASTSIRTPILGAIVAYPLDLSDFDSINLFSEYIHETYTHVDYLVNNGGRGRFYSDDPASNETHTVQGYEMSLGVMHFGQYYLTKLLYDVLLTPLPLSAMTMSDSPEDESGDSPTGHSHGSYAKSPDVFASRVVYVGSFAYATGNFDASFTNTESASDVKGEITNNCGKMFNNLIPCWPLFSCPVTNGYARASLAQVLNVNQLQSRVDRKALDKHGNYRRLVTSVVNPGYVALPGASSSLLRQLLGFMTRSSEDSLHPILYAMLSHNYIPGSYIDSMLISHDLMQYKPTLEQTHAVVYPSTRSLGFLLNDGRSASLKAKETNYDEQYHHYRSKTTDFDAIAKKLWEVSEQIVKEYESNK